MVQIQENMGENRETALEVHLLGLFCKWYEGYIENQPGPLGDIFKETIMEIAPEKDLDNLTQFELWYTQLVLKY